MTINVEIVPRDNEPIDRALKRFMKKCKKENIAREVFDRSHFKPKSQKLKEKQLRKKYSREKKSRR